MYVCVHVCLSTGRGYPVDSHLHSLFRMRALLPCLTLKKRHLPPTPTYLGPLPLLRTSCTLDPLTLSLFSVPIGLFPCRVPTYRDASSHPLTLAFLPLLSPYASSPLPLFSHTYIHILGRNSAPGKVAQSIPSSTQNILNLRGCLMCISCTRS